ncbi:MAG: LamG-like jellyroll fold domain-containing protein, partial [Candidatus Thermoplasmatota archaeon]|nr:LamG-like jellyroll fold domain-containing protein [Candidatus Thermoplasmatota archaeon]
MEAAQHNAKYYVNHDANMMRNDGINDTQIILDREAEAKAKFDNVSREVTATFDHEDKDYVTIGGYGPGWDSEWGEFSDWMSRPFQSSAAQACCACGAIKTLRQVREARIAAANVYGEGVDQTPLPPKEPRKAVSVVWRYKGSKSQDGHIGELRSSIPLEHQWVHVAATYNATTGESVLYVNGASVASDTTSQLGPILYSRDGQPNVTFMSPLNNDTAVNETCGKGEIQDVNIWRTALSAQEILSHVNSERGSKNSGTNCEINYFKLDEEKTISVVPPNRPQLPEPAADADENEKTRWKKMKELAARADARDAKRAKHVCNSLAFRYPFNNRLHRALHSDESRSLLDVMPDQWYVARPRPLNPLWGKS